MGLTAETCRYLVKASQHGVAFKRTASLGHQHMNVGPKTLLRLLHAEGIKPDPATTQKLLASTPEQRSGPFFQALGCETLDVLDMSGYEGANLLWDMNQPVPEDWKAKYDVVLDGGTLEHVFNFPVAIKNVMEMVRAGGHLILMTPCNNYCGHGFYQFSPELLYRILSAENGFHTKDMQLLEITAGTDAFLGLRYPFRLSRKPHTVTDPEQIRERVELINNYPACLLVTAQRNQTIEPLRQPPQQSDYQPQWTDMKVAGHRQPSAAKQKAEHCLRKLLGEDFCREILPTLIGILKPWRWTVFKRRHSLSNQKWYHPHD